MRVALYGVDGKVGAVLAPALTGAGHDWYDARDGGPAGSDAAVDFTTPDAVGGNVAVCLEAKVPVVIGTTGFDLEPLRAERGVTLAQLALLWLYAHKTVLSALPNIYEEAQLHEFAAASDHEPLNDSEMERVQELYERNFDVVPYAEEAVAR